MIDRAAMPDPLATLTPLDALARVAHHPTVLMLAGSPGGRTYLAWGAAARPLQWTPGTPLAGWLDGLAPRRGASAGDAGEMSGWNGFAGGALVQLDYECPQAAPRAWRVDAWAEWDKRGGLRLSGHPLQVSAMRQDLEVPAVPPPAPRLLAPLEPAWTPAEHGARLARVRELIAAGDLYQANLTLGFAGRLEPGPNRDVAVFRALAASSPAPFSAFIRAPGRATVVSHSPECFLRARGEQLASFPIKGTRRREPGDEQRARAELLASPKDRAELAMIVDLVRNDLGRVAMPGSVTVADPARVIDLPYAHHLVATVTARLGRAASYGQAIAAAFPAGSITGAPKIRAMQALRELESEPRGAYCGAFGWVGPGGFDLAVAIRTLLVEGDAVRVHAGGGIVWDSEPGDEWREVLTKASAMAAALGGEL